MKLRKSTETTSWIVTETVCPYCNFINTYHYRWKNHKVFCKGEGCGKKFIIGEGD